MPRFRGQLTAIALMLFALVALELPVLGWSVALAAADSQAEAPLDLAVKALSREDRLADDGAEPGHPLPVPLLPSGLAAAEPSRLLESAAPMVPASPVPSPRQRPQGSRAPPAV